MKKEMKSKVGVVVRHSGEKTAVVMVERLVKHPQFMKYVTRRKKFHIHDENNQAGQGDRVKIVECRPYSKTKSWRLASVLEKAK